MTSDEKDTTRARNARQNASRRMNMTSDEREVEQAKNAGQNATRRMNMTSDERDAERAKNSQQKATKKQENRKQKRVDSRPADFLTTLEDAQFPNQLSFDDDWWNHNMQPIMMYYENSGHNKFLGLNDLSEPSMIEKIIQEVESKMMHC